MKFSVAILAALPLAAAFNNKCTHIHVGDNFAGQNGQQWTITAEDIGENVEGDAFCNGLWDNMRCSLILPIGNECTGDGNRGLKWTFTTSEWCNEGDVTSAWWRATQNGFGDLQCD